MSFVNLLERLKRFWGEILNYPWDFYFKTLTRTTNYTGILLDLGKIIYLACCCCFAEHHKERKEE